MKKTFYFISLSFLLLLSSCKKDDAEPAEAVNNSTPPTGTLSDRFSNPCLIYDVTYSDSDGFVKYVQFVILKNDQPYQTGIKFDVEDVPSPLKGVGSICETLSSGTYKVFVKIYDNTGKEGKTNTLTVIRP